jgi:hypothetical protein
MTNKELQNLLDSLDEGLIGTRKDWQWDQVALARALTADPVILKKRAETQSKQRKGTQPERLMSKEARAKSGKKASERQKGKPVPQFITPEARAKVVAKNTGKKRSQEFKDKLSKAKTGLKIGHVPSKFIPVVATNVKTGEVIKFKGQVLAAEKLNLSVCNISSVLKGRQATTGGWTFKYLKNDN